MAKLVLISAAALLVAGVPMAAYGQSADGTKAPEGHQVQASPKSEPTTTKRGISEEGGMEASGASQGKGGESR